MIRKPFKFGLLIPNGLDNFKNIREFINNVRHRFTKQAIEEIQIHQFKDENNMLVLFIFNKRQFHPSFITEFQPWVEKLRMKVVNIQRYNDKEKFLIIKLS